MRWINELSLKFKFMGIVGLACLLCAGISISGFIYFNQRELENGILNKEKTIHAQLGAATEFVAKQGGLHDVIVKYAGKYQRAEQLTEAERTEILNQVPIYASLVIGKKNAEADHYEFRVFSDEPRRKENLATTEEMKIFDRFQKDSGLQEIELKDGQNITLYRPVRLAESHGCMSCHGDPSLSPWKNGTDILGYKMENWKDGKLHGVFAISQNKAAVAQASIQGGLMAPASWLIVAILAGAFIAIAIAAVSMGGPVRSLNQVAASISEICAEVSAHSGRMAASSQKLSEATTQQAASLEQTAASLVQISAMISKATDGADSAASSSTQSQQRAEEGRSAVEQMLTSMNEISESNNAIGHQISQSSDQMGDFVRVIEGIGEKTRVIDEIVFQTKLLSFNASVEAARAGEHGKGFAVVADEVGKLAQMSGQAAKQITEMLNESIAQVEKMAHSTQSQVTTLVESGKLKVNSGVSVAQQCSSVLNDIVVNVNRVSGLAQEISQASKEQNQGVSQINQAMNQLDTVTQQNASTSEETAQAAKDLLSQSASLKSAVDVLISTVQGRAG